LAINFYTSPSSLYNNGLRVFTLLFVLLISGFSTKAYEVSSNVKFVENKGQWEPEVLFRADILGGHLFVSKNCLTYYLIDKQAVHDHQHAKGVLTGNAQVFKVFFEGNNPNIVKAEAKFPNTEYYNYFIGEQAKWRSGVKSYNQIILKNVFKGVDLEINSYGSHVKTNFVVSPNTNPSIIQLRYEGADGVKLIDDDIQINTWFGDITEKKPESFQRLDKFTNKIFSAYELHNNIVSYRFGEYDKKKELIIDPIWIFGTYSGSLSDNFGMSSAFDAAGNAYAGGTVYGPSFPKTTGRFQASFAGGSSSNNSYARDCIIAKFSSDGSNMLWATYLGGSNNEQPHSMVSNSSGDLYVMGSTYSSNFPVTANAHDQTYNGSSDIFVSRLRFDGLNLLSSTFLGGSGKDGISGTEQLGYPSNGILCYNYSDWYRGEVVVDQYSNVYIASVTSSTNATSFPISNAFQNTYGGGTFDGILAKFTPNLEVMNFCTYLGGSGADACYALVVDSVANLYVTGGTTSADLPGANTSFTYKGDVDGFVLKTNAVALSAPRTAYIGTPSYDQAYLIQQNSFGDVFVVGQTRGSMSISPGLFGVTGAKHFLKCFDSGLNQEKLSTTFGKASSFPSLSPTAFVIDRCNKFYFSGWGGNVNLFNNSDVDNTNSLTITNNAFQKTTDGSDFYLMILGADLKNLEFATFYGGDRSDEHVDGGTSHFDRNFIIYQTVCAGCWGTAWSKVNPGKNVNGGGGCNIGVFKYNLDAYLYKPEMVQDTLIEIEAGDTLDYSFTATDGDKDSIFITAKGSVFSLPVNPAVFSIEQRGAGFTKARIKWPTTCKNASNDTIVVDLNLVDNACTIPKSSTGKIKFLVKSTKIASPFLYCLSSLGNDAIKLSWSTYASKPKGFSHFEIYKSVNNSRYVKIDTVANWQTTERVDNNALNHKLIQTRYFLLPVNICGKMGDSSRIIPSIFESDTTVNPAFTNTDDTLINIIKTENASIDFTINNISNKDSCFITLSGDLINDNMVQVSSSDGIGSASVRLNIQTDCNTPFYTKKLFIRAENNQCPQSRNKTKVVTIRIIPTPTFEIPNLICPKRINENELKVQLKGAVTNKYFGRFDVVKYLDKQFIEKLATFNSMENDTFSIDFKAKNNSTNNYCYQTIAYNVCNEPMDSSAIFCFKDAIVPDKLSLYTVTVSNDQEVKIVWNKSPIDSASFTNYHILKKTDREGGSFSSLSQLSKMSDTVFIDKLVDVDKHSYCYMVKNTNTCGLESINNDSACSILLKGKSAKLKHSLAWQSYDYWILGAQKYELQKANAFNPSMTTMPLFNHPGFDFADENFDYQVGLYYYKIIAKQNPNIGNAISESNTIELIQAPYVYAPNAFTPNGDQLNDIWLPQHAFVRDYNLKVFNRWGQIIFETNDKNKGFNLSTVSNVIPNDVYVYIITYTGWNEESNVLKGNFTILK
jgi:gliding motility-associated-like protein